MPATGNENELVEALGYPAFKLLVSRLGGRRLRVPADVSCAQRLTQVLGLEAAGKLVDAFGGFDIDVPNLRPNALPSREAQVKDLIQRGWSNEDIIENTGCTDRTVRRYRADFRRSGDTCPGGNSADTAHRNAR